MAAPKRDPTALAKDKARTAELYLKGWKQVDIAAELGVSQGQVSKDLKSIRKDWLTSSVRDFDEAKAEELAKIDRLEREAWEAYERTVGTRVHLTRVVTIHEEGVASNNEDGDCNGEDEDYNAERITERTERTSERTEELAGNPTFLSLVMTCIDRRCRILGIDAPQKLEHSGEVGIKYIVGLSEDDL